MCVVGAHDVEGYGEKGDEQGGYEEGYGLGCVSRRVRMTWDGMVVYIPQWPIGGTRK